MDSESKVQVNSGSEKGLLSRPKHSPGSLTEVGGFMGLQHWVSR